MSSRFNIFNNTLSSDQVNCILSYWDKDLICRFANNEFDKWFGNKPEDLVGKSSFKNLIGESYRLHLPYINKVFEGISQIHEYEMSLYAIGNVKVIATYYPDIEHNKVSGFFLHMSINNPTILDTADKIDESEFSEEVKSTHQIISVNNKINKVAEYLKSQLFTGFPTLEYLADIHLISVSKLMRDFKITYHTSPFMYYRKLQMEFAAQYIKQTGCNKKQIALMLGFSNPANFTACFKRFIKEDVNKKYNKALIEDFNEMNRLLIRQLPVAVAMLDKEMNYLVVSQRWISDFSLSNYNLIKRNFFDFFPDTNNKWRKIQKENINGIIKNAERDFFECVSGRKFWLKWDSRPWFDIEGNIGGIIISTAKIKSIGMTDREQQYFEH